MPFLIIAGVLCSTPLITNDTAFKWNTNDQWVYETATRRCGEKYPDTSPCLKRFFKLGERDYRATCGRRLK